LVDADTGWGGILNVAHAVRTLTAAGASALHIEDQDWPKRCGHRAGKRLISTQDMVDKIKAAVDARTDSTVHVMIRTDAWTVEGKDKTLERINAYVAAGAESIFAEALTEISDYQTVVQSTKVPILANITEFGLTPLYTKEALAKVGVAMVLYPLSAFRAMNQAALAVYQTIRKTGSQADRLDTMQTRQALYQLLDYETYEQRLDQ